MAYRRSLSTRARLFAQQRLSPTIGYFHHDDDRRSQHSDEKARNLLQNRSFGSYIHTTLGFGCCGGGGGGRYQDSRCSPFFHVPITTSGFLLSRNMSTTIGDGDGAEQFNYMADVLTDKTMEVVSTQAPAVSEVVIAAADSWLPVAALQYAIDGIHNFTGLNWWASIVITTLVIRTLTVPIMINQLKATTKLTILRPELEQIKQDMEDRGMSPSAVNEGQERMKRVFNEHGVSTFTPLKGLLIQGPIFVSFFLAIENMVAKVPSFKTGGAYWFLDLTTADSLYVLPVLTALTFWITVEANLQEGMEGNPNAGTMKNVARGFAALSIPFTASFPKAIFCYWITSNLFSLVYGLIIKQKAVKQFLNVPIIVPPPPSPTSESKPAFSFFESLKKYAAAQAAQQRQAMDPKPVSQSTPSPPLLSEKPTSIERKSTNHKVSPSSVLSHRIKNLEKEVKGRKNNKKR